VVLFSDHVIVVEVAEHELDAPSVLRVGDATTVVSLSHHVDERLIGDLIVEVEELEELILTDAQVRRRELVGDVPAEWSKLTSLQTQSVEEAKTPKEAAESDWLVIAIKFFVGDLHEAATNVVTETLRWLSSNLNRVLHNGDRELV